MPVLAQDRNATDPPPPRGKVEATASSSPPVRIAELAPFDPWIGVWRVKESHYDPLGKVVASVSGTEEIRWILDGHALQRLYTTGKRDPVYRAIGTLTWDGARGEFAGAWFDNRSQTGPSLVRGAWSEETRSFVFTLETRSPDGRTLRYRIVEKQIDEEHRIATTYALAGDRVIKRLVVEYERSRPCPASGPPRILFDDLLDAQSRKHKP